MQNASYSNLPLNVCLYTPYIPPIIWGSIYSIFSPLQEGETCPYDYALNQKGIYSVFVFDGAKL